MIVKIGHQLLSNPKVYDVFQYCVGSYRFRKRFITSIGISKKSQVIELGCGTGISLESIDNNHYTGIDISQQYLEKARTRNERTTLIKGDVSDASTFKNLYAGKADIILALGLWHHLNDSQVYNTLINVSKIAQIGTRLYFHDPFIDKFSSRSAVWIAKNDRGKYLRSVLELSEIATAAGYKIEYQISRKEI
jgi:SAM-dependent methyltransferase